MQAQVEFGSISGVVTDASGATVQNAAVAVVNTANGATRNTTTGGSGDYRIPDLTPGNYKVTVTAPGFAGATETLNVAVGSASQLNVKLSVKGDATQVIVAADNSGSVNLQNAEVSQVIDSKQIVQLPSLTRNPYDFAQLSGFASGDPTIKSDRGVGLNFSGARSASTDILLDGAENTDAFAVGVGQTVPLDAVQEYRVITSGMGAQYGRASGGIVNVVTRSGGNSFHGSAWEFNRISTFASDGYSNNAQFKAGNTDVAKPRFTRNQFGYSVGGPIVKDKLFFFSSTEWLRIRSQATIVSEVPDPALIAASASNTQSFFSAYGKLAHPVNGRVYTAGYLADPNNSQPFQSDAAGLIASGALTADTPAFDTVSYQTAADSGAGAPQNTWYTLNRFDYTLSDKTTLFGRYSLLNGILSPGTNNTSPYAGYETGSTNYDNNGLGSLTHVFGPRLASTTKVLFSRLNNLQPLGKNPVSPTLYVNSNSAETLGSGSIYFPGYSATSPGNAIPFGGPQNSLQVLEDLNWTIGAHTLTLGGEYLYIKDNRSFGAYEEGVEALVQSGTKGALKNFVNGNLGLFQAAVNPQGKYPCSRDLATGKYQVTADCTINLPVSSPNFSRSNRYHDGAAYLADTWKATPRLTIDAGLRWEVYGPQHSTHPNLDSNFFFGPGDTEFDRIRTGSLKTRVTAPNGRLWKLNLLQFGPRIGVAYDLSGDGKTSLRAGYGIAYERNFNNVTFNVIQNPPNYAVVSFTKADLTAGQSLEISTGNLGQFGTGTGTKFLPNTTLRAVDPNIKPAYNQFYVASLQHQVGNSTVLRLEYTGERGIHNYSIANLNRSYFGGVYEGDAHVSNRLNPQFSNINFRGADGDSYYNGLNVGLTSANIRSQGLTVTANYTYSHAMDNTSSTFTDGGSNNTNLGYLDPFNHGLDRGSSDFDIRHRVASSLVWDLPYAHNTTGITNRLLDGWQLASIFTASTGTPFSYFDCSAAVTACPRAMPLVAVPHARTGNSKDISSLFGPNTFSYITLPEYTPTNYTMYADPIVGAGDLPTCTGVLGAGCSFPGNMTARNAFRGPGRWNVDFDAVKAFKITESTSLQLRGEAYNVLNHANTYLNLGGSNDISSTNYVLAYKDGRRQMQLAARFVF